jgi:hypothetical protein
VRVGLEVVGHPLLGHERAGIAVELEAGEPVVPRGSIGHQRVPAPGAPLLGDASPLQDHVRHPGAAQVLTHRHARLTTADDDGFDLFDVHACRARPFG